MHEEKKWHAIMDSHVITRLKISLRIADGKMLSVELLMLSHHISILLNYNYAMEYGK